MSASAVRDGWFERVSNTAFGPRQTAVVRIGIAGGWLFFLLREWPNRHQLWGPDGPYTSAMAQSKVEANGAFTALLWSDGALWFELMYAAAIVASAILTVGWRTRTASVLFMLAVLSVQNRNTLVADGGDQLFHLMSIYLVGTRCGRMWSLDAWQGRGAGADPGRDGAGIVLWFVMGTALGAATVTGHLSVTWAALLWGIWLGHGVWWAVRRYTPGEPRTALDLAANVVHNGAVLVIVGQVCLLYGTAGWYKIQGGRWQDGTAAYYPMHVDAFNPWPALSDALSSFALPILLMTYGTVIVQVAFPFALFNRRLKNVLLVLLILEHLGIAVLLALPFLSLVIIAADMIFLPTSFLVGVERKLSAVWRRRTAKASEDDGEPMRELDAVRS